jgi:hypothetical protein
MKSSGVLMAHQGRLPLQSKYDLDQFLAEPSKMTRLPVESLPDVLAQVVSRVGELKHLEGTLLSILFGHRNTASQSGGDDGKLLSAPHVAKMFDVPESWVREQARLGKLPSIRLGHYVRFKPEEIARFVAARDSNAA